MKKLSLEELKIFNDELRTYTIETVSKELKDFCEEKLKSAKLKINKIIKKNKDLVIEDFE